MPHESWKLESGLVDEMDFWITKSQFGFLSEYQNGDAALLIWYGESPDAEIDRPVIWPLGTGWEVSGDGKSVKHPKRKSFVDTSMIGRMVNRLAKELAIGEKDPQFVEDDIRVAKAWEGLGFRLKRETIKFPGAAERGLKEEVVHLMPVAYLGRRTGKAAGSGTKTATTTARTSSVAPAASTAQSSPTHDKLTKLAKGLTLDKFQKAATNLQEVQEDPDLLTSVMDDSEAGFWAVARQ